jgi:hypothetical protein
VQAVVNTIALERPLEDAVFEAARRDLPERVAAVEGIQGVHMIRTGAEQLVLVILGDDEAALDRMRDAVGNEWMRAHVVPNAAAAPQRAVGEVVFSYTRG